jgi:hypothetical protein
MVQCERLGWTEVVATIRRSKAGHGSNFGREGARFSHRVAHIAIDDPVDLRGATPSISGFKRIQLCVDV